MIINPGQLKHRYKVFTKTKGVDSQGFKTETLSEIISGKCAITSIITEDNEKSSSKEMNTKKTLVTCIMRYNSKIDENCIVELNGKQWRVKSLLNINFENRYLKMVMTDV